MVGGCRAFTKASDVCVELPDIGDFLDGAADATEQPERVKLRVDMAAFAVSVTPFSTTFLAEVTVYRVALVAYWINILAMGAILYVFWVCAVRANLVEDGVSREASESLAHRVIITQLTYGGAAVLCIVSRYRSLSIMVAAQLFYAFAPRVPCQRKSDD